MKSAYEAVTRWVRFNALALSFEVRLCNERWMAPVLKPYLAEAKPSAAATPEAMGLVEEVASAIWLMQGEREALQRRVAELFGPKAEVELSESVTALFAEAGNDACGVRAALESVRARADLLTSNGARVDAHTRLVLRKHALVLTELIAPCLEAVVVKEAKEGASAVRAERFKSAYAAFLPSAGRPHPDDFLTAGLLAGMSNVRDSHA